MDLRKFRAPDRGIVRLQSFDQQKEIYGKSSLDTLDLGFVFTNGCGICKKNQPFWFGCRHIVGIDADTHEGVVRTIYHQYLCKTCWKLIEKKKFDWEKELGLVCRVCTTGLVNKLKQRNPELVLDLFNKKR